jgi:hypothetical protein
MRTIHPRLATVGSVVALLLVAGGAVAATSPRAERAAPSEITACVSVRTGAMRIPTDGRPCATTGPRATRERVLTWDRRAASGGDGAGVDPRRRLAAGLATYSCADGDQIKLHDDVKRGVGYDPEVGSFVITTPGTYRVEFSGRGWSRGDAGLAVTVNGEPSAYLADRSRSDDVESRHWAALGASWVLDLAAGDALGLAGTCLAGVRPDERWSARLVVEELV